MTRLETGVRLDRTLSILSHRHRRQILFQMHEHGPANGDAFTIADLRTKDVDETQWAVELSHVHLPKLAETGYIEWDRETHTVRRGSEFDEVAPIIAILREHWATHADEH
jgi:hypothetical protein